MHAPDQMPVETDEHFAFTVDILPEQVRNLSEKAQESTPRSLKLLGKIPFIQVQSLLTSGD